MLIEELHEFLERKQKEKLLTSVWSNASDTLGLDRQKVDNRNKAELDRMREILRNLAVTCARGHETGVKGLYDSQWMHVSFFSQPEEVLYKITSAALREDITQTTPHFTNKTQRAE